MPVEDFYANPWEFLKTNVVRVATLPLKGGETKNSVFHLVLAESPGKIVIDAEGRTIGKVYDLTGPQSLTMAEFAQEFSRVLGRTIQYVNVPPQIWEARLRELHQPEHLVAHLLVMGQLHRDNRYDRMTDTFRQLVGREPISAAEFARRNAAAFTPA